MWLIPVCIPRDNSERRLKNTQRRCKDVRTKWKATAIERALNGLHRTIVQVNAYKRRPVCNHTRRP